MNLSPLPARVDRAIRSAGIAIVGVSIGSPADKATWKVTPVNLQAAAQPTIDAFDMNDPALDAADLDYQIQIQMDVERLISAVIWVILDTFAQTTPATIAKYNTARAKVIAAFKAKPWQ